MLTDTEIRDLISSPKRITQKSPSHGYKQEGMYIRCDLTLERVNAETETFSVFICQNSQYIENYSIGLQYKTRDKALGSVTLVRYNGPHGETSKHKDGHYNKAHIHRITAEEIQSGSMQPQESHREITDRYNTFEEALKAFFEDTSIENWAKYFPELDRMQRELFDER